MNHGKTRVESDGFLQFGYGLLFEVLTDHHLGKEQVSCGTARQDGKRPGKGRSSFLQLLRLQVANPEQIRGVKVCWRKVRLNSFQQRDGMSQRYHQRLPNSAHLMPKQFTGWSRLPGNG